MPCLAVIECGEGIITKLMAEPVTKIDGKLTQSNIDNLENELTKHAANIEDIIGQGKKYGSLIIVVGLSKYKFIIRNPRTM